MVVVCLCLFQPSRIGGMCEDIPTWISLCCDSVFAYKKDFSIFEFPERFSEISCRDLTIFSFQQL
jgi:hypothetical protein